MGVKYIYIYADNLKIFIHNIAMIIILLFQNVKYSSYLVKTIKSMF